MSGFFDKIKDAFSSKKEPKYKIYEAQEIKMIALRTRVILTEHMEQLHKHITQEDQKFKFIGSDPREFYTILQSIGEKVIEAESIKIFIEMMRKVQNNCMNIAKTNGDISLLKTQLLWFQCVLWYRRSKEVANLEDLYNFCLDFFKGVDITREMDINCEVFNIYPILKYLKKNDILPLHEILFYLQPYVSCNITKPTLDAVFEINRTAIQRQKEGNDQNISKFEIKSKISNPSQVYQKSNIYPSSNISPANQTNPTRQSEEYNPYEIKQPAYNISSYQPANTSSIRNTNPTGNTGNASNGNFNNPQQTFASQQSYYHNPNYGSNTLNQPYGIVNNQQNSQFNIPNAFEPQNSNYFSPDPASNINHNPFSSSSKFQNNNFNQSQNSNFNPNYNQSHNTFNQSQNISNYNPIPPEQKKPEPYHPIQAPKKSFFNSLMRSNSNANQEQRNYSQGFVINNDRERQANDFAFHQNNQSQIPFNRQQNDNFNGFQHQSYAKQQELEEKRKKEAEELKRRAEEQRKAEEAAQLQLLQKAKEEEQKRLEQLRLAKEKQEAQRQQRQKQEQQRRAQEQKQQAQRKAREEEQRRQKEQEQRQRQREQRMRERQREQETQLNVFVDNQRQEIDRGYSGRFSSNMGFKYDFGQEQGEEFTYNATENMNSSLMKFNKQEPVASPVVTPVNYQQIDEAESLQNIEKSQNNSSNKPYKLFYYRTEN